MPFQTRLPEALARFGLKVELVPGWQTRGSSSFAPRGAVAHWTAGPKGSRTRPSLNICTNGRAGLPGPLCNVYLDRDGVAVVVAAGRANHAGVGGWRGLTGNSQVFGTEAECGGDGDWTAAQRWAYPRVNAAYCWLGGFGPEMVCGHHEWAPTRKIDIRDWPMSAMRAQVAEVLANPNVAAAEVVEPPAPYPTGEDMIVASELEPNRTVYGVYSGGILTGLASDGGITDAAKAGKLFVLWVSRDDWFELDRKSRLLLGEPERAA